MTVIGDITTSLDGFVTGPNAGVSNGLGDDGEALHAWVFSGHPVDRACLEAGRDVGAVVMGRRLFDVVDAPDGWQDGMGFGADVDARPPHVVVTTTAPEHPRLAATHDLRFVAGVRAAVATAREAAGDRDVVVMGGGRTVGSCLEAGLLDRLVLHVSPLVLGAGTPLFDGVGRHDLVQREVTVSPHATHVVYDVP